MCIRVFGLCVHHSCCSNPFKHSANPVSTASPALATAPSLAELLLQERLNEKTGKPPAPNADPSASQSVSTATSELHTQLDANEQHDPSSNNNHSTHPLPGIGESTAEGGPLPDKHEVVNTPSGAGPNTYSSQSVNGDQSNLGHVQIGPINLNHPIPANQIPLKNKYGYPLVTNLPASPGADHPMPENDDRSSGTDLFMTDNRRHSPGNLPVMPRDHNQMVGWNAAMGYSNNNFQESSQLVDQGRQVAGSSGAVNRDDSPMQDTASSTQQQSNIADIPVTTGDKNKEMDENKESNDNPPADDSQMAENQAARNLAEEGNVGGGDKKEDRKTDPIENEEKFVMGMFRL